jgi:hypothetical protein
MLRTYVVPCTWKLAGSYTVIASSMDAAIDQVSDAPLPDNGVYVGNSYRTTEEDK